MVCEVQSNFCLFDANNVKLSNSLWNKEDLPDQWKESIIVQIHEKGVKTDCSNYRGISLLSTSYKILFNIHM
jgi:hypothetical protein